MKTYLVSYDLNSPGQNYDNLINELCKYPGYCHVLKSQWFICSEGNSADVFNHLRKYIDKNDRLLISELTANHVGWLDQEAITWLNKSFR